MGESQIALRGKTDGLKLAPLWSKPQVKQIQLLTEFDLHIKLVEFIRRFFPEAIIVAGLGEMQDSADKRIKCWKLGYTKSQCDLLVLNRHKKWLGLAIELKTPKGCGIVSPEQFQFMDRLKEAGFKTLLSNDHDLLIKEIVEYFRDVQTICSQCGKLSLHKHKHLEG